MASIWRNCEVWCWCASVVCFPHLRAVRSSKCREHPKGTPQARVLLVGMGAKTGLGVNRTGRNWLKVLGPHACNGLDQKAMHGEIHNMSSFFFNIYRIEKKKKRYPDHCTLFHYTFHLFSFFYKAQFTFLFFPPPKGFTSKLDLKLEPRLKLTVTHVPGGKGKPSRIWSWCGCWVTIRS